jgi:2-polyprenyl-3-methyl-5-hydroxy-6-metoxy-1,4-benzoquinol methylase
MILFAIRKIPFLRNYYFNHAGRKFVNKKLERIFAHTKPGQTILDIGSGNGLITKILREKNYIVTPLDIHEGQYDDSVKPIIYDGKKMPFANKSFDTGILLTILHHTTNQEEIILEAARACHQLIVMEDIYKNQLQKYYTFLLDSFVNLFYSPCPHTNRTDKEWKALFSKLNLNLEAVYYKKLLGVQQVVYILKSETK